MEIDVDVEDMLEREVKKIGTGCHVILPRRYLGRKAKILILKKDGFFND